MLEKTKYCCSCAAMRGAMDGDVAAERQLNVVERLLVRMPRGRGSRVHTDGSVSVYPASSRARLPAEKQKSSPRLSKLVPRASVNLEPMFWCPGSGFSLIT